MTNAATYAQKTSCNAVICFTYSCLLFSYGHFSLTRLFSTPLPHIIYSGMLTPIGQTSTTTYHSSHLLQFAFKPKSLTLSCLEFLADQIVRATSTDLSPTAAVIAQNEERTESTLTTTATARVETESACNQRYE